MIRPEARQVLMEWREIILGGFALVLGARWVWAGHTYQPILGGLLLTIGVALIALGWRRVRFPEGGAGPGLVEVTERQITYLTGTGGGAVAIEALARIEVLSGQSGITWIFTTERGDVLHIPGDARGSEAIFDALVSLPGLNYDQASEAAKAQGTDRYLIWQRDRRALH